MTVNCKAKVGIHGTNFKLTPTECSAFLGGSSFNDGTTQTARDLPLKGSRFAHTECSARHWHWHWQWGHGVHNARTQARCDSVGLAVGAHTGARTVTLLGARVTDSESQAATLKAGAHWCPSATVHSRYHP